MNGAGLLRCICDDTRFGILELLQKDRELCVGDFVARMGRDQPLISHHLRTLKKCGIVKSRCQGKKSMYSISSRQLSEMIAKIVSASKRMPVLCADGCC